MAELQFVDLTVDNLFDCCTVLDAIGTDQILAAFDANEIKAMSGSGKDSKGIGLVIGMKICGIVVKNIPKARDEIYTFIANCCVWDNGSKVTVEDIREMKIGRFMKLLKDFFKKDDLTDFFREVAGFAGLVPNDSENLSGEDTATLTAI